MTEWVLHATMRRSVAMRSSAIAAPKSFAEAQVRDGFGEFRAMCAGCHGAPGRMRSAVGKGLRPRAPDLAQAARNWDSGNLFWIVKNGIKMTGMPAFGPTHDDQTIWNIVAFVSRLPDITPEQYRQFEEQTAGSGDQHAH
jgi:mono/diheme cytochrome c family protein